MRQCIALRGHDESNESDNLRNFLELMKIRADDNCIIDSYYDVQK